MEAVSVTTQLTSMATEATSIATEAAPIVLGVIGTFLLINLGFKLFKRYGSKIG